MSWEHNWLVIQQVLHQVLCTHMCSGVSNLESGEILPTGLQILLPLLEKKRKAMQAFFSMQVFLR